MERPFYHDDVIRARGDIASEYYSDDDDTMMKKDMSVNLSEPSSALKPPVRAPDALLSSTDAGLLKLASPELERLIIQSNGMVTTTPTSQFLYQKAVSDEQEFAEGFVKALEDLHKQNQLGGGCGGGGAHTGGLEPSSNAPVVSAHPDLPVYTNLSSYGSGPLGTTVNYSTDTVPFPPPPSAALHVGGARLPSLKDEPQTVPDVQSFGDSPPLSPINMDTQERIKAERKKLRNRIAASKCRKRKLERISRLEDKVKTLKTQNTDLASTASLLREQVAQLKQKVMNHVNSGCQLLPHQVQAY